MSRNLTLLVPQIHFHTGCLTVTKLTGGFSVRCTHRGNFSFVMSLKKKKKKLPGRADLGQALQYNLPRRQVAKAARHSLKRALEWES